MPNPLPEWVPINWGLVSHPVNWAIVALMVVLGAIVLCAIGGAIGIKSNSSQGE